MNDLSKEARNAGGMPRLNKGKIVKEGELEAKSNMHFLHIANFDKLVAFYNLDVIIRLISGQFCLLRPNERLNLTAD